MKYLSLTYVLLFAMTLSAKGQSLRLGVEKKFSFSDRTSNSIEIAHENNFEDKQSVFLQTGISYKCFKGFRVSTDYRYNVKGPHGEEGVEGESRINVDMSYKRKTENDYIIKNRLRYQFEIDELESKKHYVRNKLKCAFDLTKSSEPYFYIEPYYSFKKESVDKVKFAIGNDLVLFKQHFDMNFAIEANIENEKKILTYQYNLVWSL